MHCKFNKFEAYDVMSLQFWQLIGQPTQVLLIKTN